MVTSVRKQVAEGPPHLKMNDRLHPSDECRWIVRLAWSFCSQAYLPPVAAAAANAVVKGENWWSNGNFEKGKPN
ncbi:hypothetical protein HPP92_028216 [Vanilla planifolia]|uniref:Uncharacterized protein n=1 Tax=Vanilla planifolia TaxID=51239 RepID=A0A835P844_VANPL|nr:hypothetical protein HPP92_028216 [Vanilla planifolia]